VSHRTRGAVASALLLTALTAACADAPVSIDTSTGLTDAEREACQALVEALPDRLAGEERRLVAPAATLGAAWGDPAIVLRCGVPQPDDFTDTSTCVEADGVGWYVPDTVLLSDDETLDVTMTAVGYRPRVQVVVPGEYRPEGFTDTAATVGRVVDQHLEKVRDCR
jgi:hypothetical protein